MDDPGWRKRMSLQECVKAAPQKHALAAPSRQPCLPDPHDLMGVPPYSSPVSGYAIVGIVAPHHRGQVSPKTAEIRHKAYTVVSGAISIL
jgi:hypothetical protein